MAAGSPYVPPGIAANAAPDTTQPSASSQSGIEGLVSGSGNIPALSGVLGSAGTVSTSTGGFVMTDGWYVTLACAFGIVTADTKIGPIVLGILTVGLIYQLTLLVQGK